ncbi:MAG: zinc ribbon domain-containing protein [Dehalococcoidia bacterium]|nr:zinc ribbon domain-containing protein [Dehalococcoidia bacterium]
MFLIGWPGGSWQATATFVAVLIGIYVAALWLTMVFWAARDIRQRTTSPAAYIAAPVLVLLTFLPGVALYLVLRPRYTRSQLYARMLEEEALRLELDRQVACPSCARPIRDDYLVCPACAVELKSACASCSKPLANAWVICPYCGVERPAPRQTGRRDRGAREPGAPPVLLGPPAPAVAQAQANGGGNGSKPAKAAPPPAPQRRTALFPGASTGPRRTPRPDQPTAAVGK